MIWLQKNWISLLALIGYLAGYSITTFNGKIIKDVDKMEKDLIIKTFLRNGTIKSKIVD